MRLTRRFPIAALCTWAVAALLATAVPASAQPQNCPPFYGFTTSPATPTDDTPTSVTLFGCWPCVEVASTQIVTGTEVEVVLRSNAPCTDTVYVWQATFDFGVLPAGNHRVVVTVRDEANPKVGQTFENWFMVFGDPPPPPQPPPPLPPAPSGPLFVGVNTEPSPATTDASTVLVAYGFYPFWCGFVSDAQVLGKDHVALTLRQHPECTPESWTFNPADTMWHHAFNLGLLEAGMHDVTVSIRKAFGEDSLKVEDFTASFEVFEAGPPPPPPPPPIDSVFVPSPNPFADRTEVGMIVGEETNVEVAIFDVAGRRVRAIYRGPLAAGTRSYAWDGKRDDGARARAGVYFYRVLQPGRVWTRRVVLLPPR